MWQTTTTLQTLLDKLNTLLQAQQLEALGMNDKFILAATSCDASQEVAPNLIGNVEECRGHLVHDSLRDFD